MADEKILNEEILNDGELDGVAGGSYDESYNQMMRLNTELGVGFYPDSRDHSVDKLGELYNRAGMKLEAHNSDDKNNRYFDRATGREIGRNEAFGRLYFAIQHHMIDTNC